MFENELNAFVAEVALAVEEDYGHGGGLGGKVSSQI
jgi:hypothetical protein